jgi:hypothetical protein
VSRRVPAWAVLELLHQEADKTGNERHRITAATLRSWAHRGHISPAGRDGYDLGEILGYLDHRATPTRVA